MTTNIKNRIMVILGVLAPLILSTIFIFAGLSMGGVDENGRITLTGETTSTPGGYDDLIEDSKAAIYESAAEILARITETDAPTDQETIEANDEPTGQGFHTSIAEILARRKADGDNDNGRGWQCSKYTAYLATGKKDYSNSHTDYGPVNGNQITAWLVKNYGFKYIDAPVAGAIGSGGFNTKYGHTVMYLENGVVNHANWSPLKVSTNSIILAGYKWVVPGDYEPETPAPTAPTAPQEPAGEVEAPETVSNSHTVRKGETLGGISLSEGWWPSANGLYGDSGYAQRLADFNNIKNRGLIYPNQVIRRAE